MTSNDVFDVISAELCLPARRAEDYKPLVPKMCEPINKEMKTKCPPCFFTKTAKVEFENLWLDSDIQGY